MEAQQPESKTGHGRRRFRGVGRRVVLYPLAFYAVWCSVLYFYQDAMIFPADMAGVPPAEPKYPGAVVIRLQIEDGGHVKAWFIPAPGIRANVPGPVALFFHGNAETIGDQDHMIQGYHRLGWSVMLPEYRGYGHADGRPSQKGIVGDAVRFYDELTERADVDVTRIVIHGRSLGGAVAAQVAARRKPAAFIAESTFTSIAAMARKYGAPSFLTRHPFRTDRILPNLEVPTLIFHGSRDRIIPVTHGRRLRNLIPQTEYLEYDCGHNDFPGYENRDDYWQKIGGFLVRCGLVSGSRP